MLDWKSIGREKFERITAALIRRHHSDASNVQERVTVPDARGGDQGIDVLVVEANATWVYQQKYFPEGFSGGWKDTRRAQIRGSFDQAMRLDPRPDIWTLVVPANLNTGERNYLNSLTDRVEEGPKPEIQWIGQAELDDLISRHQDLEGYALRDAASLALERAGGTLPANSILHTLEDYTARLGDLDRAAQDLDPDWTPRFITDQEGNRALTAVPKHRNARPIEQVIRLNTSDMDPDTRLQWERVVGYGVPGKLRVTTRPGNSFYRQAPQFLIESHNPDLEYEYLIEKPDTQPHSLIGKRVELRVEMADHTNISELVTVTSVNQGILGILIELQSSGASTLELRAPLISCPDNSERKLHLNLRLHLAESSPQEGLDALNLHLAIRNCERIVLDLPAVVTEHPAEAIVMEGPNLEDLVEDDSLELEDYRLLLEDIVVVQHHTGQKFMAPTLISEYERTVIRFLRLLLEGHVVSIPRLQNIGVTLDPEKSEASRGALSGEGFSFLTLQEEFSIKLWGRHFTVPGPVATYHPAVRLAPLDDSDKVAVENIPARITTINGGYFVAYRPNFLKAERPSPTPWGLRNIREQPTYDDQ